jgi:F-type H+-transporting ATPase subunit epsilon
MGMMAGRSPLLTRLGVGALRLEFPNGVSRRFLIDSGFAQVQATGLTLLTEKAGPAEELNAQEGESELAAANARVSKPRENQERVQHDQQLAMAKIALARSARQRS